MTMKDIERMVHKAEIEAEIYEHEGSIQVEIFAGEPDLIEWFFEMLDESGCQYTRTDEKSAEIEVRT